MSRGSTTTTRTGGRVHVFLLDDGANLPLVDAPYDIDARRVRARIARLGRAVTDRNR